MFVVGEGEAEVYIVGLCLEFRRCWSLGCKGSLYGEEEKS